VNDAIDTGDNGGARAAFGAGAEQVGAAVIKVRDAAAAKAKAAQGNAPPKPPLLLALGDSWFAYWPRGDILDCLEDRGELDTVSLAWAGAKLTEVLDGRTGFHPLDPRYRAPQTERLVATLRGLSEEDRLRLKYIAVSAGGNDVADENGTLTQLVALASVKGNGIDEAEAAKIIDVEMRDHYARLLGFIDRACAEVLQRRVRIVLHGYDWPVPDGRPALPPAWLKPVFIAKGYTSPQQARALMKTLIQRLNTMQKRLIRELAEPHIHHIDLQGTLTSARHQDDWQNELHPTIPAGFGQIAVAFSGALAAIDKKAAADATKAAR
jgi:hypothetical protein